MACRVDQNYYMTTQAILYSSGLVFWVPPVTFKTSCDLDYSYWPWDVQVSNLPKSVMSNIIEIVHPFLFRSRCAGLLSDLGPRVAMTLTS